MGNKHWMEREGEPDLTGDEMIEFLDEYCKCVYICDRDCWIGMEWAAPVMGRTTREAINNAAAVFKEINCE